MRKPTLEALTTRGSPTDTNTIVNLELVRKFMGKVPFQYAITSAYRSPEYNRSIGGSTTSQHPNGLAVDICPPASSNCIGGAPRKDFYAASSEGLGYDRWAPTQAEVNSVNARFPQGKPLPWGWILGAGGLTIVAGLGAYFYIRSR